MRTIKFRAKTVNTLEWVYGYLVKNVCATGSQWNMHMPPSDPDDRHRVCAVIEETIGQHTGIYQYENEFYEGDIIEFTEFDSFGNDKHRTSGTIEFYCGSFMVTKNDDVSLDIAYVTENDDTIEIIGNIHQEVTK